MNTETIPHVLEFADTGIVEGLHTERLDLSELGWLEISRASSVEFNDHSQQWEVFDYTGNAVFQHHSRQECLDWERRTFDEPPTTPEPN